MKKTMLIVGLLISVVSNAQKSIVLQKGQVITTQTTSDADIDMSMGGMKNANSNKTQYTVIGEDATNYTLTSKIIAMKMSVDGMGQSMTFDSEKPEDMNGEVGTQIGGKLKKIDTMLVAKKDGKITMLSKNDDDNGNPMMMGMDGQSGQSNIFVILPSTAPGTTWTDSITVKNNKIKSVYSLQSVENGIATVKLNGTMDGTNEIETQGMTMTMTLSMKSDGILKVNTDSGLVISNNTNSEMTGNMDVMGQQIPINSKIVTTSTVQ